MGRFIDSKQVVEFAESIPKIFHKMGELKMDPPKFFILGNGEREEELAEVIKGSDFSGIDIEVGHYSDPYPILAQSKIFFSLQKDNNYPSKGRNPEI